MIIARSEADLELTMLAHHSDETRLREVYLRTPPFGRAGMAGVTVQSEMDLVVNLASLLERFKLGRNSHVRIRCGDVDLAF